MTRTSRNDHPHRRLTLEQLEERVMLSGFPLADVAEAEDTFTAEAEVDVEPASVVEEITVLDVQAVGAEMDTPNGGLAVRVPTGVQSADGTEADAPDGTAASDDAVVTDAAAEPKDPTPTSESDTQNQAEQNPDQVIELFNASPALFVENQGQWTDDTIEYGFHGAGANIAFRDGEIAFQVFQQEPVDGDRANVDEPNPDAPGDLPSEPECETHATAFTLSFDDANEVTPVGLDQAETVFNYFVTTEGMAHAENVSSFTRVGYEGLYDGIDLVTFGQRDSLKYEFRVAPGADPEQILLTYTAIVGLTLDGDGALHVETDLGDLIDPAPYIYQEIDGERIEVAGAFTLVDSDTVSFTIAGAWDSTVELIIDPDLDWSTYLGGSSTDSGYGMATDAAGNVFVTGGTYSSGWVLGGFDTSHNGGPDAFVAKLSAGGGHLWSTYLGGSEDDFGYGVATDVAGNVFVTGVTDAAGWVSGGFDTSYNGGFLDAFVAKLSAAGGHLWSTCLGGSDRDDGYGIATDAAGDVFVTGYTRSSGWVSGGFDPNHNGGGDAFVAKLSGAGDHLWSTYLGGSGWDLGYDIATDAGGDVFVTGATRSSGWVLGGFDPSHNGDGDAFVAKLSATGGHLWSTYLGGYDWDVGHDIATDAAGDVFVTGDTESSGWVSAGFDPSYNGGIRDAFVAKLSATGEHLWSTYLGGSSSDGGSGIATDAAGNVYVTGETQSSGWVSGGFDTTYNGGLFNAFVAKLSAAGGHLWSTYLGGSEGAVGCGIATDAARNVFVTGVTSSSGWITGGFDTSYNGGSDAFVARITDNGGNVPPALAMADPAADITVVQGQPVYISWADTDPDDNACISLAFDPDIGGTPWEGSPNHTWITVAVTEDPDGSGDQYQWDTTGVPLGTHSVWGVISDGTNPAVYSCAPGLVTVEVDTATNYAVLFSGGARADANHFRYYDNIRDMYETFVDDFDLDPANVYVLFADGTDAAVDRSDGQNSDMSFAAAAHVLSATHDNLESTLETLADLIDQDDHFLFWSYDHGSGDRNVPSRTTEEVLNGWGNNIRDDELADWLDAIEAGYSTYVFNQCYSGGMLDEMTPLGSGEFGAASANHYEPGISGWPYHGFPQAFHDALELGFRGTYDLYRYALDHTDAATDGEGPGGTYAPLVQHPWSVGDDFPIFYTPIDAAPTMTSVDTLGGGRQDTALIIRYDDLIDAADEADADGNVVSFLVESASGGTLTKNGVPISPGETTLGYGEALIWLPPTGVSGNLEAFTVRAWDGLATSDTPVQVSVDVVSVVVGPALDVTDNSGSEVNGGTVDSTLKFPQTPIGETSEDLIFDLTNPGTASLNVSAFSVGGPHDGDFAVVVRDNVGGIVDVSGGSFSVAAGASYTIEVDCAPSDAGSRSAEITFTTNDPNDGGASRILSMNGSGIHWNAPTLTTVTTLEGAVAGDPLSITYDDLAEAADEADVDPETTIEFRIEGISSGTLTKDGQSILLGTTVVGLGESVVWVPSADAMGITEAFAVKAWDLGLASDTAVPVPVSVSPVVTAGNPVTFTDVDDDMVTVTVTGSGEIVLDFTGLTPDGSDIETATISGGSGNSEFTFTYMGGGNGVQITSLLDVNSSFETVLVEGDVDDLDVAGSIASSVEIQGELGTGQVGVDVRGDLIIGTLAGDLTIGDDVEWSGEVQIGTQTDGTLLITDDLKGEVSFTGDAGGTVEVGDGLYGTFEANTLTGVLDVGGTASGLVHILGDATGLIEVGLDLGNLRVDGTLGAQVVAHDDVNRIWAGDINGALIAAGFDYDSGTGDLTPTGFSGDIRHITLTSSNVVSTTIVASDDILYTGQPQTLLPSGGGGVVSSVLFSAGFGPGLDGEFGTGDDVVLSIDGRIGNIGSSSARFTNVNGHFQAAGRMYDVNSSGDLTGTYLSLGDIDDLRAGGRLSANVVAGDDIDSITAADIQAATILAGFNWDFGAGVIAPSGYSGDIRRIALTGGDIVTARIIASDDILYDDGTGTAATLEGHGGAMSSVTFSAGFGPGVDGIFGTSDDVVLNAGRIGNIGGFSSRFASIDGMFQATEKIYDLNSAGDLGALEDLIYSLGDIDDLRAGGTLQAYVVAGDDIDSVTATNIHCGMVAAGFYGDLEAEVVFPSGMRGDIRRITLTGGDITTTMFVASDDILYDDATGTVGALLGHGGTISDGEFWAGFGPGADGEFGTGDDVVLGDGRIGNIGSSSSRFANIDGMFVASGRMYDFNTSGNLGEGDTLVLSLGDIDDLRAGGDLRAYVIAGDDIDSITAANIVNTAIVAGFDVDFDTELFAPSGMSGDIRRMTLTGSDITNSMIVASDDILYASSAQRLTGTGTINDTLFSAGWGPGPDGEFDTGDDVMVNTDGRIGNIGSNSNRFLAIDGGFRATGNIYDLNSAGALSAEIWSMKDIDDVRAGGALSGTVAAGDDIDSIVAEDIVHAFISAGYSPGANGVFEMGGDDLLTGMRGDIRTVTGTGGITGSFRASDDIGTIFSGGILGTFGADTLFAGDDIGVLTSVSDIGAAISAGTLSGSGIIARIEVDEPDDLGGPDPTLLDTVFASLRINRVLVEAATDITALFTGAFPTVLTLDTDDDGA